MNLVEEPDTTDYTVGEFAEEIEKGRIWLKENQEQYRSAKAAVLTGSEREAQLRAFQEIRTLVLSPPPKGVEDACYRLGYLKHIIENATQLEIFIVKYEMAMEQYKQLKEVKRTGYAGQRRWLGMP